MKMTLDPTRCEGRGLCAAVAPEILTLDEWGYPVMHGPRDRLQQENRLQTEIGRQDHRPARRAARACPLLALNVQR